MLNFDGVGVSSQLARALRSIQIESWVGTETPFKTWSLSACFRGGLASVSHSRRQRSCSRWRPLQLQFTRKPQIAKPLAHRYNSYTDLGSQGSLALNLEFQADLGSRNSSVLDSSQLLTWGVRDPCPKRLDFSGTLLGSRSVVYLLWFFISSVL